MEEGSEIWALSMIPRGMLYGWIRQGGNGDDGMVERALWISGYLLIPLTR